MERNHSTTDTSRRTPWILAAVGVAAILLAATTAAPRVGPSAAVGSTPQASPASGPVVDSILPIAEELRRFRAALPGPAPTRLSGGAPSRDALVGRFLTAVEAADTAALRDLLLTPAEFAWLHYPHTRFTAPPYELAPSLLWFQIENGSSRGFHRLMQRIGGRPAHAAGHTCPGEALTEGPNRLWEGCVVHLKVPGEPERDFRMFGSILERDGVFKFVSYSNGF